MQDQTVDDVIDGTASELVPAPAANLFRADDPVQVVQRATEVADALKDVITSRGMLVRIQGREHCTVDGWQVLGSMIGVTAVCEWTRPMQDGWEARVVAQTLDGRVIGAAEAQCTRTEKMWSKRDDYALRSMAQTRATSKALKGPLGFVVKLAGFEPTPADEMPADAPAAPVAWADAATEREARDAITYLVAGEARGAAVAGWFVQEQGGFPAPAARLVIAVSRALRHATDIPDDDAPPAQDGDPDAAATEVPF